MRVLIFFFIFSFILIPCVCGSHPFLNVKRKKNVNFFSSSIPNYTLKVEYSPLFPGIQKMALGFLPRYGEVLGVWRHTQKRAVFYLYEIIGKKIKLIGKPFFLPPKTPPYFCFLNESLWLAFGSSRIVKAVWENGEWKVVESFPVNGTIGALEGIAQFLLVAKGKKPGWYSFILYTPSGMQIWHDSKQWHGRAFGFAQSQNLLWVSIDRWDGTSSTLACYKINKNGAKINLQFLSYYSTSAFVNGKILINGLAFVNGRPAALCTVWVLSRYGMKRTHFFFLFTGNRLKKFGNVIPFGSEKIAGTLLKKNRTDLLVEYEPNKEVIEPMAICIFSMGHEYHDLKEKVSQADPASALAFFLKRKTIVQHAGAKGKFNPLPFKHFLLPWQWKAWREHVAKTGHEGIWGISGPNCPYAHSWKAIADPDPRHTVWACEATPEDYLAGRVKGTRWAYIPFDEDLREPVCERCHPIRTSKPSPWSMYNVVIRSNQLTPDGMRAPEQ
jgi:hypothetical protein